MTTTLLSLLQKVSENLGDYKAGTLTTSSASVPADTSLANNPNNKFNEKWLMPTAGTYAGVERNIETFTKSGGVMDLYTDFAGATGTVAYIISSYQPSLMRTWINRAISVIFPDLWVPHIDEWSLISNNILPNALPADWASSSAPDKWTVSGLTATQETTAANLRVGSSGLKMVSGGSNQTVMCTNSGNKYLTDVAGRSITLKGWVYSTDASKVALRLFDTAQTLSSYHAGDSKWHLLTLTETLAQDPTNVSLAFGYYIASTGITAYAQQIRLIGPTVQRYLLPTSFKKLEQVWLQTSGNTSFTADAYLAMCDALHESTSFEKVANSDWYVQYDGTDYWLIFNTTLPYERRLKLVGTKYGSTLTNLTDTVEFNSPQTELISWLAAHFIALDQSKRVEGADNREEYRKIAGDCYATYQRLLPTHKLPRPQNQLRFSGS